MDCCSPVGMTGIERVAGEPQIGIRANCSECSGASRFVTKRTMLLMLKPNLFDQIGDGQYYFCVSPGCDVVYFPENQGTVFRKDDLRVRVGIKEASGPKPLCYCFGFDEADFRDEVARTGKSESLGRIADLLKAGMCACETRNPSGACCLGDITKAVKRMQSQLEPAT